MFSRGDLLWLGSVMIALSIIFLYGAEAGRQAEAPPTWPGKLERGSEFTLALFAHPRCPCTKASLRQLEKFLEKPNSKLKVYVIFVKPPNTEPDFHESELWRLSKNLPVTTLFDESGQLSESFGAYTSGQALLYDGQGKLSFSGGLTAWRGHEGDSIGLEALECSVAQRASVDSTEVYGCPLLSQEDSLCRP